MGVINTGSFAKALFPGLKAWFGQTYEEWPVEFTELYDEDTSDKAYEEFVGVSGFGLAQEKTEGAPVVYDEASQSFVQRFINRAYALGFIITKEMIDDNQYNIAVLGKDKAQALAFSMRQTKEILGANVYNRGFNASYLFGDGVQLFSSAHPMKAGGTFYNTPIVAADISEAALEQACIDIGGFTDDRGKRVAIKQQSLHIPWQLEFEAKRILESVGQNDTGNNALNAVKGIFPKGVKVSHYLTDPDAWFIRTNAPKGMLYLNREDTGFDQDNDYDTKNAKFQAYFRCSFGNIDPRGVYGSPGA